MSFDSVYLIKLPPGTVGVYQIITDYGDLTLTPIGLATLRNLIKLEIENNEALKEYVKSIE